MKMNADYRVDYILNKGDQIYTDHEIYTITGEPLGFGGSSILYPACRRGSDLEVAIKEWFPRFPENFERRNGIIQPRDPNDAVILDEHRKRFEAELMMGEQVRNNTVRAIHLWGILKPTKLIIKGKEEAESDVSKGLFAVMERMDHKGKSFNQLLRHISEKPSDDSPLKTGGLPNIHTTALIIEQVLLALQRVHEAGENGYIFGDIQDGNIYFADCRLEQGDIGTGMLLDFGCSRPLIDGKKTDIIGGKIFSSKGFTPPELLSTRWQQGDGTISIQADVFSVGCLMLRCLFPIEYWDHFGESPSIGPRTLRHGDAKRLGIDDPLRRKVNAILAKAMHPDLKERYPTADAMLEAIQELKRDTEPPKYLLPSNLSSPDYWVPHSRDRELAAITKSVNDGETVFLHGIGGIGKSETARALAKQLCPPRGAFLIHYRDSMRETIMHMNFSGYKFRPSQNTSEDMLEEMEYQDRLRILKDHYRGTALVIDNFNVDNKSLEDLQGETAYQDIIELSDISFIFTTRYEIIAHPEWEIKALGDSAALQILKQYCPQTSDILLKRIISAVHGHTLTLTLIGKSIRESQGRITAARVLEALENNTLSQIDCPVISSDKDRKYRQADIYAHLKILFNLSSLSEMQKSALIFAAFLSGDGLPYKRLLHVLWEQTRPSSFNSYEENEQHRKKCSDAFHALIKYGWLKASPENIITIHPVIQELVIGELKPSLSNCERGLIRLQRVQFPSVRVKVFPDSFQLASYFSRAGKILNEKWYMECGERIRAVLVKQDAKLAPHIKSMAITQRKADVTSSELADRYEQIGLTHIALDGHGKQAIDSCLEALRLRENDPQTTKEQLAWSLFYVGLAYQHHHGERGCWVTDISDSLLLADDYHRRALSLWNGLPPFGVEFYNIAHDKDNYGFETAYSQMLSDYGYWCFPEVHEHDDKILYWLEIQASLEDTSAMVSLARRCRDGIGCIKDLKKSYYWATMAVAVQAKHDSLELPNSGKVVVGKDCVTDYGFYEKRKINSARVFLASQIINGNYYTPSPNEETYWIWYAAEAGDIGYMIRYALCLINGAGCSKDYADAFEWLTKVAKLIGASQYDDLTYTDHDSSSWLRDPEDIKGKNAKMLEMAHQMILHNFDAVHIQKWYHCAVTAGNLEYIDSLGKIMLNNATRTEDYCAIFDLFQELSSKGSVLADYYLGWMCINGFANGNTQDIDRGVSFYSSAAFEGCEKACLALAAIYFGLDAKTLTHVPQDPSMALLFCSFVATSRREESEGKQSFEISDILQMIAKWEATFSDEDWNSEVYFALHDFYYDYAFETHRIKAEKYLAKGNALTEIEHKESSLQEDDEVDEEMEKIVDAIINELEESMNSH